MTRPTMHTLRLAIDEVAPRLLGFEFREDNQDARLTALEVARAEPTQAATPAPCIHSGEPQRAHNGPTRTCPVISLMANGAHYATQPATTRPAPDCAQEAEALPDVTCCNCFAGAVRIAIQRGGDNNDERDATATVERVADRGACMFCNVPSNEVMVVMGNGNEMRLCWYCAQTVASAARRITH